MRNGVSPSLPQHRLRLGRRARRHRQNHPDAQIERAPVIVLRNIADPPQHFEQARGSSTTRYRSRPESLGSMRGVLSVIPPPVMCAAPRSSPAAISARIGFR